MILWFSVDVREEEQREKLRTWSRQSMINAVSAVRIADIGLNKAEKIFVTKVCQHDEQNS
jgi:hypothetical protein